LPPGVRALVEYHASWLRQIGWQEEAAALAAKLAEIEWREQSRDAPCVVYGAEARSPSATAHGRGCRMILLPTKTSLG